MDNFQIETAQNVNIAQNVAGIGERILAYIVDSLIIGIFIMLVYIFGVFTILSSGDASDGFIFFFVMVIGLPVFLYHLLWETFWNGRSPGKAMMKLRVVKLDGTKPAFSNYLLRWLLRVIDISTTSGGLATMVILFNGKGQRLGDIAAKTTVIDERVKVSILDTLVMDLPEDYVPTYPQVTVFKDNEIQTIKSVLQRARYGGNQKVINTLVTKVSSVMEVTPDGTPIQFLDTVIKDYNYYTQSM